MSSKSCSDSDDGWQVKSTKKTRKSSPHLDITLKIDNYIIKGTRLKNADNLVKDLQELKDIACLLETNFKCSWIVK